MFRLQDIDLTCDIPCQIWGSHGSIPGKESCRDTLCLALGGRDVFVGVTADRLIEIARKKCESLVGHSVPLDLDSFDQVRFLVKVLKKDPKWARFLERELFLQKDEREPISLEGFIEEAIDEREEFRSWLKICLYRGDREAIFQGIQEWNPVHLMDLEHAMRSNHFSIESRVWLYGEVLRRAQDPVILDHADHDFQGSVQALLYLCERGGIRNHEEILLFLVATFQKVIPIYWSPGFESIIRALWDSYCDFLQMKKRLQELTDEEIRFLEATKNEKYSSYMGRDRWTRLYEGIEL